jgi:D-alanine-D-alanine ligase
MLLDLARIPYTGSGPFALTLALHKHTAKDILRSRGVPTPGAVVFHTPAAPAAPLALRYPLIVKPTREDASVGIASASVVHDAAALEERVRHVLARYQQPVLVEEFVEGREIYVSLLERLDGPPQILPFFEIDFSELPADRPRIVSFEGKWVESSPEYIGTKPVRCAGLSPEVASRVATVARAAFEALELRDYGRIDIRLAADGTPYVIDVNPNCDLSDLAGGFSRAAKAAGLSYDTLIARLLELALARRPDADSTPLQRRSKRAQGHAVSRARPGDGEPLPTGGGVVRVGAP